jgi:hypothetical protein
VTVERGSLHHVELWVPDLPRGLNHLAFHAGTRADVDGFASDGAAAGWALLFADRHPYAAGSGSYAAYLANTDGFEVELIAG